MKTVLYGIILVLILMAPVNKQDIGDLEPIQAVWLYTQNNQIALQTDTGDYGAGTTVEEAISKMKQNSQGIVYLDTAQYVLVSENAVDQIENLVNHLKSSVRICQWEGNSVRDAAKYMQAHDAGSRFKDIKSTEKLEVIPNMQEESGR